MKVKKIKSKFTNYLSKLHDIDDAIFLLKRLSRAKFLETAEVHINLNTFGTGPALHGIADLPNSLGKKKIIAALGPVGLENQLLHAGAVFVKLEDIITQISSKKILFDTLIATPERLPQLSRYAKILASKLLFPTLKTGTVTNKIIEAIQMRMFRHVEFKADRNGSIHLGFGKLILSENKLKENLCSIYFSVNSYKPVGVKGNFIKSMSVCSTIGKSLPINLLSLQSKKRYKSNS